MDHYNKVRAIQEGRRERTAKLGTKKCIIRNCPNYVAPHHAGYDDAICGKCWRKRFKLKSSPYYKDPNKVDLSKVSTEELEAELARRKG